MAVPTNEQLKARVTFLNSVASGSVVASVITPAIGLSIGVIKWPVEGFWVLGACVFWLLIAGFIHDQAYRIAEKVK